MITLYHDDCFNIFPIIEDKSVDLILCDMPYGTTACKWDTVLDLERMWVELKRIIKDKAAIVLTGSQPFTSVLISSNIKNFKCEWIYQKNRGSNFACLKYVPMKEHENILVFGFGLITYNPIKETRKGDGLARSKRNYNPCNTGKREVLSEMTLSYINSPKELRYPGSIQKFNIEVGFHPTQKPVALMEYLIKTYSNEGNVILDFCMGSGTTGVACINTNREFIGIEKEERYFNIARKRIGE